MITRKNDLGTQEFAVQDRWIVHRDHERVIVNERVAVGPNSIGYINPMMIDKSTNTYINQREYTPQEFEERFTDKAPSRLSQNSSSPD